MDSTKLISLYNRFGTVNETVVLDYYLDSYNYDKIKLHSHGQITAYRTRKRSLNLKPINERKQRSFTINKRKIKNGCTNMVFKKESNENVIFVTLTLQEVKTLKEANKGMSKFLKHLTQNFKMKHYLWVAELGETTQRLHYHMLLNIPFFSIKKFQRAWNTAQKQNSNNSVRLSKGVVKSIKKPAKYITKYISKSDIEFDTKCYGMSTDLYSKSIVLDSYSTGALAFRNFIHRSKRIFHEYCMSFYLKYEDMKKYLSDYQLLKKYSLEI